mmetsp:Transcript_115838/g.308013  ORF Transcript_115838/g.308013 Transcript_115838/m.308013 type:complete len:590 (+) Transcript_115838:32-1801(+)
MLSTLERSPTRPEALVLATEHHHLVATHNDHHARRHAHAAAAERALGVVLRLHLNAGPAALPCKVVDEAVQHANVEVAAGVQRGVAHGVWDAHGPLAHHAVVLAAEDPLPPRGGHPLPEHLPRLGVQPPDLCLHGGDPPQLLGVVAQSSGERHGAAEGKRENLAHDRPRPHRSEEGNPLHEHREVPARHATWCDHCQRVALAHAPYDRPSVRRLRSRLGRPHVLPIGHTVGIDISGPRVVAAGLHRVDEAVGPDLEAAVGPGLVKCLAVFPRLPDLLAIEANAIHATSGILEEERLAVLCEHRVVVPHHVVRGVVPQEVAGAPVDGHHLARASGRGLVRPERDDPLVRGERPDVATDALAVALTVCPRGVLLAPGADLLGPPDQLAGAHADGNHVPGHLGAVEEAVHQRGDVVRAPWDSVLPEQPSVRRELVDTVPEHRVYVLLVVDQRRPIAVWRPELPLRPCPSPLERGREVARPFVGGRCVRPNRPTRHRPVVRARGRLLRCWGAPRGGALAIGRLRRCCLAHDKLQQGSGVEERARGHCSADYDLLCAARKRAGIGLLENSSAPLHLARSAPGQLGLRANGPIEP